MNLAALQLLAAVIPRIVEAIHFAESLFPKAGSGAQKLEHVLTRAEEIITGLPVKLEALLPVVEKVKPIVEGIVAVFNKLGIFQHGTHATAPEDAFPYAPPDYSAGAPQRDAPA